MVFHISAKSIVICLVALVISAVYGYLVVRYLTEKKSNSTVKTIKVQTTFNDIAGTVPVEISNLVAFVRDRERFAKMGARAPRGILLTGKPGTGKTLLVRALAGETESGFFHSSGSDFIEMYVGVGAKKIRNLFETARQYVHHTVKPVGMWEQITQFFGQKTKKNNVNRSAIIFIDEIDAIGRREGDTSENRQTINQLLTCMDGFDQEENIIVVAATNNASLLDSALKRSGRFDYIIEIAMPSTPTRHEILRLYAEQSPLADDIDLMKLAKKTNGFSGADLKTIVNVAAIHATLDGSSVVAQQHLEAALARIVAKKKREK